jgi:restriction system protein
LLVHSKATSNFSKEAVDYVNNIDTKIILIDGERLAELMIEHNVGVSRIASYEIKKIDTDYFIEE